MKLPLQQFQIDHSSYERPNQKWVCGHAHEGCACEPGPDSRGRCPALEHVTCSPVMARDKEGKPVGYRCTRSPLFGGACEMGPLPDGRCCQPVPAVKPCQPRLSLRARRNRLTWLCAIAMLGLVLLMISGPWAAKVMSPGPLVAAHAGLRLQTGAAENCALCHQSHETDANVLPALAALGAVDSSKCVDCHWADQPAARLTAFEPHGQSLAKPSPASAVVALAAGPQASPEASNTPAAQAASRLPTVHASPVQVLASAVGLARHPQQSLQCTVCHRDHHGHNVSLIPDSTSCLACHGLQFSSFSEGHPPFRPRAAKPGILFNHQAHAQKDHYGERAFNCADCHLPAAATGTMATLPFEKACASCHSGGMDDHHGSQIRKTPGMTVFRKLDPDDADAEPGLPAVMALLLASEPASAKAVEAMGTQVLADMPDAAKEQIVASAATLQAELAGRQTPLLQQRLEASLGRRAGDPVARSLAQVLASLPGAQSKDPAAEMQYRVQDHADAWMTQWITLAAAQTASSTPAPASPDDKARSDVRSQLFKSILEVQGKTCLKCHVREGPVIHWHASTQAPRPLGYRKFDHHTHQAAVGANSCVHCHAMAEPPAPSKSVAGQSSPASASGTGSSLLGLRPIAQQQCAACHRADAGTDNCLTCHSYHLHKP